MKGIQQKKEAGKIASRNVFVPRKTQQGITDNLAVAEANASQGLSDGAKQQYITNSDRALSSSLEAILKSGSSANFVGEALDTYNQGISRFALAEDEARIRSLKTYMDANKTYSDDQDLNWQINDYAQWANKAQLATTLSEQSSKNISGAFNTIIGAGASYMSSTKNPNAGTTKPPSFRSTSGQNATTTMIAPTPMTVNYTNRSLGVMNALRLRPTIPADMIDPNLRTDRPNRMAWDELNTEPYPLSAQPQ